MGKFFKKIFKTLIKILIIIAVVIIVIAAVVLSGGTALTFLIPFGLTAGAFLAIGIAGLAIAFMVDPETTSEYVGRAVGGIKDTVGDVLDKTVEAVADATDSILNKFWWLIPLGGFVYYNYNKKEDENIVISTAKR